MTQQDQWRIDGGELRRLLARPQPPAGLAEDLRTNWWAQREPARRAQRVGIAAAAAVLAAAVATVVVLGPAISPAPELVAKAYGHVRHERDLRGRFFDTPRSWLARHRLSALQAGATLTLAKNCEVDGNPIKHLRLRTANGGVAEVLVTTDDRWGSQQPARGRLQDRRWQLLQPGRGTTVLVIHNRRAQPAVGRLVDRLTGPRA